MHNIYYYFFCLNQNMSQSIHILYANSITGYSVVVIVDGIDRRLHEYQMNYAFKI